MSKPTYSMYLQWSEEDEAWIATSPELGVTAIGLSPTESAEMMEESIAVTIEAFEEMGRPLPEPNRFTHHSGQMRLRLPKSLHGQVAQMAANENTSLNSLLVSLISAGLAKIEAAADQPPSLPQSVSDEIRSIVRSELDRHRAVDHLAFQNMVLLSREEVGGFSARLEGRPASATRLEGRASSIIYGDLESVGKGSMIKRTKPSSDHRKARWS